MAGEVAAGGVCVTKLKISDALELPPRVVTEKLGFLGRTGSGKSYAAMKLAEQMAATSAQFIALDPVGIWWGLRLAADGKTPGIALPVFGGLHGDVPLEPGTGALIADLVVDRGISCVIDVSQFESDADKARFAEAWASRFYFRKKSKPSAVHVFIEEAQEFVPENSQRGEERMLHAFTRLQKLGRNFGIGTSLISQRPQEVNKKALNMTELLFAFQMTGPQERKTMTGWISEKGIDEDIGSLLPKLSVGTAHVWSPSWLQISETVKIGKRWTFDASSTPKVGTAAIVKELASIDLEQLRASMAATIEKAKAEDPKLLRARIAELTKELAAAAKVKPAAPAKPTADEVLEIAKRARAQVVREYAKRIGEVDKLATRLANILGDAAEASNIAVNVLREQVTELKNDLPPFVDDPKPVAYRSAQPRLTTAATQPRELRPRIAASVAVDGDEAINSAQQKMLDAIAFYDRVVGRQAPTRKQIAGFCGVSWDTGTFRNNLSRLRVLGLIADMNGGIALTDAGSARASDDAPPTLEQLHRTWRERLSDQQSRMMQVLIDAHPQSVTREHVAEKLGVSWDTGTFRNNLSKLRVLGVLEDSDRSHVAASDLLFPAGLQ